MYEELYAQNKGLLTTMARRCARLCGLDRAIDEEDLMQAGFIGLVRARRTFDPAGDKTWAAWAIWYIRAEMYRALGLRRGRFTRADVGAGALDDCSPDAKEDDETLLQRLVDESLPPVDEALLREELCRGVREAVARLECDDQRRATQLVQLEGRSYREAAGLMGISAPRVRALWNQAGARLSRDKRLRQLADLDERTRFHAHKGVAAFNRDWTSVTEGAALWRVEQQQRFL